MNAVFVDPIYSRGFDENFWINTNAYIACKYTRVLSWKFARLTQLCLYTTIHCS